MIESESLSKGNLMAAKSSAKPSKRASKKPIKKAAKKKPKPPAKDLRKEVVDWVKANPGRDVLRVALDEFGVSYEHLTEWLKKEGIQVKEAVETLIKSRKDKAAKKGGEKLKALAKAVEEKKADLKKLAVRLKSATKKKK